MKALTETQQKWLSRARHLDKAHEGLIGLFGLISITGFMIAILSHIMFFAIPATIFGLMMWFLIEVYSFSGCAATNTFYRLMKRE